MKNLQETLKQKPYILIALIALAAVIILYPAAQKGFPTLPPTGFLLGGLLGEATITVEPSLATLTVEGWNECGVQKAVLEQYCICQGFSGIAEDSACKVLPQQEATQWTLDDTCAQISGEQTEKISGNAVSHVRCVK